MPEIHDIAKIISSNTAKALRGLDSLVASAMGDNSETIIDLNVSQLEKGLDSDGLYLGDLSSDEYATEKILKGGKAPKGKVDLINEGDYTSGFFTKQSGGKLLIDSSDEKSDKLDNEFPKNKGLTTENKKIVADEITPDLRERLDVVITNGLS